MGYGEFGSNGSVHWKVSYRNNGPADHSDVDPVQHSHIGRRRHPGKLRVTARFRDARAAREALQEALDKLEESRGRVVQLDVGVRPRQKSAGPSRNWEIRVDW
jgi:hypothetical protein